MLEESKLIFKRQADTIEGWQSMSKQQLADMYIENENNKYIADGCVCALAVKSWNLIGSNYVKNPSITTPEDCYDILMESISYVLEKRRWLREDSNIYQDKNGFDKALNRRMKSLRLNKYVEAMRQKNRVNYLNYSVDSIVENCGDVFSSDDDDIKMNTVGDFSHKIITDSFKNKKYFKSFLFDIITNADTFKTNENNEREFSYKRTCKILRNLDNVYCDYFSERYGVSKKDVSDAVNIISQLNTDRMITLINREFRQCRHDDLIRSLKSAQC